MVAGEVVDLHPKFLVEECKIVVIFVISRSNSSRPLRSEFLQIIQIIITSFSIEHVKLIGIITKEHQRVYSLFGMFLTIFFEFSPSFHV